jgi:hypothetical protein
MHRAAFATGTLENFRDIVHRRMNELSRHFDEEEFVMPVGLCLVLPKSLGGDKTAQELIRRYGSLGPLSKKFIDFYFFGWETTESSSGNEIGFNQDAFQSFLNALRGAGVKHFGQNADLILVDAHRLRSGGVSLDFTEAIRIDLSVAIKEKKISTLGSFLGDLLEAAETMRGELDRSSDHSTFKISDRLGLLIAKNSFVSLILKTWGKIIGADKMAVVVVKNLGPKVLLDALRGDATAG